MNHRAAIGSQHNVRMIAAGISDDSTVQIMQVRDLSAHCAATQKIDRFSGVTLKNQIGTNRQANEANRDTYRGSMVQVQRLNGR